QADGNREQAARESAAEPRKRKRHLKPADVDLKLVSARGVGRHGEDSRRVSAGRLEHYEAEVDDARDAELQVQGQARDDVDPRVHEQVCRVVRVHPAAARAPRLASRPWGRSTITRTRMPSATTSLYSG